MNFQVNHLSSFLYFFGYEISRGANLVIAMSVSYADNGKDVIMTYILDREAENDEVQKIK